MTWEAVVPTLFRSRSLLSSFLSSLADFITFSEESPRFSHFLSKLRSLSFLTSSSCLLHKFSASWRSLLLCRSSSLRLRRSFSFCRRSFSRSLSWSVSRSLNSFRPCSSVLQVDKNPGSVKYYSFIIQNNHALQGNKHPKWWVTNLLPRSSLCSMFGRRLWSPLPAALSSLVSFSGFLAFSFGFSPSFSSLISGFFRSCSIED